MKNRSPIFVLFITIFIDLLGFGLVIPILPIFSKELQATPIQIGFIAGLYSLMNFLFAPLWGTLSDRIGRRPVMLVSIMVTMLSYVFFAFTQNLIFLAMSRIFSGIGSANISTAQAYISDITQPKDRAKNMGLIGAAFGLGFIFGPPAGGYLKSLSGSGSVQLVGFFAASLCAINLVLAYLYLPESIKEKNRNKAFRFRPLGDLYREMKKPVLRELFILNFLFIAAFSMMQINSSILWIERFRLNEKEVGLVFMFTGIMTAIVQGGLVGKLNAAFGEKKLLLAGNLLMAIGLASIPYYPEDFFYGQFISMAFIAVANGCMTPSITSLISQSAAHGEQGQALGMNQSFGSLARVVGPAVGGFLYQRHFTIPFITGGVLMLIGYGVAHQLIKQKIAKH